MSKVSIDVEQKSSIYALDNLMFHLLDTYGRDLPKNIRNEFETLIDMLDDEVYKGLPNGDIEQTTLYERMTIETYDEEYIPTYPKERISVYDLITMYKNNIPLPRRVKLYLGSHQLVYKIYLDSADDSFLDYEIEDRTLLNTSEDIQEYLTDCLLQYQYMDKLIEILDTKD